MNACSTFGVAVVRHPLPGVAAAGVATLCQTAALSLSCCFSNSYKTGGNTPHGDGMAARCNHQRGVIRPFWTDQLYSCAVRLFCYGAARGIVAAQQHALQPPSGLDIRKSENFRAHTTLHCTTPLRALLRASPHGSDLGWWDLCNQPVRHIYNNGITTFGGSFS